MIEIAEHEGLRRDALAASRSAAAFAAALAVGCRAHGVPAGLPCYAVPRALCGARVAASAGGPLESESSGLGAFGLVSGLNRSPGHKTGNSGGKFDLKPRKVAAVRRWGSRP